MLPFFLQCGMSTGGNAEGYGAPTPQGSFIGKAQHISQYFSGDLKLKFLCIKTLTYTNV